MTPPSEIRVLIIDDSPEDHEYYQDLLTDGSDNLYSFQRADIGQEGLESFLERHPDCVLLDYRLPDMTGLEFLHELNQNISEELIPVIMLTGVGNESIAVEAMKSGAKDYLVKEKITQESLQRAIHNTVERVKLQYRLKQAQQEIIYQERMRAMGEMASGIAHDFNNALTPILGFTEVLLDFGPSLMQDQEKARKYLKLIQKCTQDASEVVKRLYQFYRPRQEVYKSIVPEQLIDEIILMSKPKWKDQAQAEGKTIRVDKSIEKVPRFMGNPSELRELMLNLVFNAVDASSEVGRITIELFSRKNQLCLNVTDTGKGMPEEIRMRCFDPFFTTKESRGSGLGLSMVYGIVQRHQGTIDVESTVGQGTKFMLRFPYPQEVETAKSKKKAQPTQERPKRILLVDDEKMNLEFLSEVLRAENHTVVIAEDGLAGWRAFELGEFDLVITDLSMPNMNGDILAAKIKESNPEVPVVMLTGFADIIESVSQKPKAIDLVVRKPIGLKELRNIIHRDYSSTT